MAGPPPGSPSPYRDIVESKQFEAELKASGLHPLVADRILEGVYWALARDPTLQGRAIPPTSSGSTDKWLVRTRRVNAADPILWVYYTFGATTITFEGVDVQMPPDSHRL